MKLMIPSYSWYLFGRIAAPMALICITLTGVGWLAQSLRFIDYIVNRGLGAGTFFYLSLLILPSILWIIIPIALFISIMVAFHKLTTESELVIFRGAGMSTTQLLKPVLYFTLLIILLSYSIGLYLLPASYREFKDMQSFIRNNYAALLLQEGVFATPAKGLTLYIREREDGGVLNGLLVHDSRTEGKNITYMAESGTLQRTEAGPRFLLMRGNRQEVDLKTGQLTMLEFLSYPLDFSIFSDNTKHQRWREAEERYLPELLAPTDTPEMKLRHKLMAEGHQRLSFPLLCFVLMFLAMAPFVSGEFSRRGYVRRIAVYCVLAISILVVQISLTEVVAKNIWLTPILYGTSVIGGVWLYFRICWDKRYRYKKGYIKNAG